MEAEFFTSAQVAEMLQVSPRTLANWRSAGRGPAYVKQGGLIRYSREALIKHLAARTVTPQVTR